MESLLLLVLLLEVPLEFEEVEVFLLTMFSFQQLPLVAFVDVSRFNAHLYSEVVRRSVIIYLQRLVQIRSQLFGDERLELEVHDHMAQVVPVVLHRENVALPLVVLPAAVVFLFLPVLV